MKRLVSLFLVASLAGCASTPFTFEGENASKGFVVLSTGLADACMDEFNNTNLLVRRAGDDEMAVTLSIKNAFYSPEVEKNNVQINSFPLDAGEYVIRDFIAPNPLFAFKQDYFNIDSIKFTVKPGQIQYQGYIFFDALKGACSKEKPVVALKDMKKRDMKVIADLNPQLFSAL